MSAKYPSFNDREFDLLKALANNTAELASQPFIPSNLSKWNNPAPTTIAEAINRIAAASAIKL